MADQVSKVNKFTEEIKKKKRLNADRLGREENHQAIDEIMEAGQDNRKKGIAAVQKEEAEKKRIKDKIDADALTEIESKKQFHESYKKSLAAALGRMLESLDWIIGWDAYCLATDKSGIMIKGRAFSTKDGVLLVVLTPDGRVFHQGIMTTGDPVIDYSALYTMAAQVENTMDHERKLLLSDEPENPDASENPGVILDQYGKPAN